MALGQGHAPRTTPNKSNAGTGHQDIREEKRAEAGGAAELLVEEAPGDCEGVSKQADFGR